MPPEHKEALDITEVIEYPSSVELGETLEVILDGNRVEAFITDNVVVLDPASPEVRTALRGYALGLAARKQVEEAKRIMRLVGKQG